jgi:predicted glycoside hydrolase/deacetylase ChbG (UPF0249 family)
MTRHLIVHADDLGSPEGTVDAISELFQVGILTSTSAMVNQPDWPRAAALLRAHPEWDAGVHLVMNDGRPVLPVERVGSLVNDFGIMRDGTGLLLRYPLISRNQLMDEWRAQIERFIADTGRNPSHLDLHCHYPYVFPAWFRLSVQLAVDFGRVAVRLPFDDALEDKAGALSTAYGGFPRRLIMRMGRRYRQIVAEHGLARTNYWESSFSQEGSRTVPHLLRILDNLGEGTTELLCHPGTEGWRMGDYAALLDPQVRLRIAELGIQLTDYRALVLGAQP